MGFFWETIGNRREPTERIVKGTVIRTALAGILLLYLNAGAAQSQDLLAQVAADLENGQLARAESEAREFLRLHPDDPRAGGLLGASLDAQQKLEDAEKVYQEALGRTPGSALLWNNFGNHLLVRGDTEGARRAFEKARAIDPSHPNANLQLARLAVERHQGAAALAFLGRLRDLRDPALQVLRAEALYWAGRKLESYQTLDSLESAHPGDTRLPFSAGLALSRMGQYARAEAAFGRALAQAPGDSIVRYNLGLAAAGAGHDERAGAIFQSLLQQRPDDVDALFELGGVRGRAGDYEAAIPLFTQAARLAPQRAEVQLALARALEGAAFCEDSARVYDHYVALRPDDDLVRRERAKVYSHVAPLREKSQAEFEWYIAKHPTDPLGHLYFGLLLQQVPDWQGALKEVTRAIELDPLLAEARRTRAALLRDDGELEKALIDLEFLVKHDVKDARSLDQLGVTYLAMDRAAEAERTLRQALALEPNDTLILLHLGRALMLLHRAAEAKQMLARSERNRKLRGETGFNTGLLAVLAMPATQQHVVLVENLRRACAREVGNPELRLQLANALLAHGEKTEASQILQDIYRQSPPPDLALRAARTALPADLFQLAADFYQIAVAGDPSVRVELAMARYFVSGAPAALVELEAVPAAQRSADYYLLKARILDLVGRTEESVQALNRGLAGGSVRPAVAYQAAGLLVKANRCSEALALLERTAKTAPDNPAIALARAIVLDLAGQTRPAEAAFARVEARWPEWGRPYLVHALAARASGKTVEAARLLQTAAALGEADSPGMTVRSAFLDSGTH